MEKKPSEWKLTEHVYALADTGDYDGHYELHIGNYTLWSNDEVNDAEWDYLQTAINLINEIPMIWYDPNEGVDAYIVKYQEKYIAEMYRYLQEKGLSAEYEEWYIKRQKQDGKDNLDNRERSLDIDRSMV